MTGRCSLLKDLGGTLFLIGVTWPYGGKSGAACHGLLMVPLVFPRPGHGSSWGLWESKCMSAKGTICAETTNPALLKTAAMEWSRGCWLAQSHDPVPSAVLRHSGGPCVLGCGSRGPGGQWLFLYEKVHAFQSPEQQESPTPGHVWI